MVAAVASAAVVEVVVVVVLLVLWVSVRVWARLRLWLLLLSTHTPLQLARSWPCYMEITWIDLMSTFTQEMEQRTIGILRSPAQFHKL